MLSPSSDQAQKDIEILGRFNDKSSIDDSIESDLKKKKSKMYLKNKIRN